MNFNLFKDIFGNGPVPDKMISASISEDDLGILLRVHLISEHFLQAFISAVIDKGNLYYGETKDEEKIRRGYFSKLNTAKNLGLPEPTFIALQELNSARNEAAHQIECDSISTGLIEALENCACQLTNHTDINLNEYVMQTFNDEGKQISRYKYDDSGTPLRVKLLIVYNCLVRRSLESLGLDLGQASSTGASGSFLQDSPPVSSFSAKALVRIKP